MGKMFWDLIQQRWFFLILANLFLFHSLLVLGDGSSGFIAGMCVGLWYSWVECDKMDIKFKEIDAINSELLESYRNLVIKSGKKPAQIIPFKRR